jgi:hypothetical protein
MRKTFNVVAILGLVLAVSAVASADFSWQTQPVLGTAYSTATGNVVMTTTAGVITIPYPEAGDPPDTGVSMTEFLINPNVWDGAHWYDPNVNVFSGSGVNLDSTATYSYTGVFSFLGSGPYDVVAAANANFSEPSGFIMLNAGVGGFWREDIGPWKYTETWTDNATGASITSSCNFNVVPNPAALWGGLSLIGLIAIRRGTR